MAIPCWRRSQLVHIFPMTERVLNLVTYIQWEKPQVIEYDKICNGLKALSEILSIYSYIINIIVYRSKFCTHQIYSELDNGESSILQNFSNLRQNIIYYITQSFTFIYALIKRHRCLVKMLMFGKRMESIFHRTIKLGLLKRLSP